jgi:anaerobic magnesium-protoporphyrin IX monomethyl ester cyclase
MLPEFVELIKYLRINGVKSHFTIGGHLPSIEFHKILELIPEIDSVVRHEGELTLLELFNNLDTPENWPNIKGIAYRKGKTIESTPPRPLITDLDSLPFPTRRERLDTFRDHGICPIQASRGCFYNCSYCSIRQFYKEAPGLKRRTRSPQNVATEMEQLFNRGVRFFKFIDDDLGMRSKSQQDWLKQFTSELKTRGLADNIIWRFSVRVDELDVSILKMLKEVGMDFVFLGIEAGCEQSLKTFNKGYHVADIYRGLAALEQAGVDFDYGFMLFDPECSFASIRENLGFLEGLCNNGRVGIRFTKVFPYVGTAIAQKLEDEGRLKGSLANPNYDYHDKRLQIMEAFVYKAFHDAFFGSSGLVGRMQMFKFDCRVVEKFYPDKFDVERYSKQLNHLIQRYNDSALETLTLALNFVEKHSYKEILRNWGILETLANEELEVQSKIHSLLTNLNPSKITG